MDRDDLKVQKKSLQHVRSSLSSFKAIREATDHMDTSPIELTSEQHKSKLNYVKKKSILKSTAFCSTVSIKVARYKRRDPG